MRVNSTEELERALMRNMRNAMKSVEAKALADMYDETGKFYTGGEPKEYQRTGALGDTPRTTKPTLSGDTVEFKAYLDTSGGYTTGKKPSMEQVLTLADKGSYPGLRPTVGKGGFWERAEQKIEKALDTTMKAAFK